jgi:hypothetical protein
LQQTYGANAWRVRNYLLESTVKQVEKALEDLKQLTVDVNRERKNAQVRQDHAADNCKLILSRSFPASLWKTAERIGDTLDRPYLEYFAD